MKPVRRVLPALLMSVFAGAAVPAASAAQFSNVVVFGDSLSDAGYFRPLLAAQGLPSSVVSVLGRFTTNPGPVWSEIVTQYYGALAAPSNAGGSIFAQGGARVTQDQAASPGVTQRPASTQISEYLARNNGVADPAALHAMWIGGNEILANVPLFLAGQITQAQLQANVLAGATAEIQQVGRLYAAGARYVMVFSLPDVGITPFALAAGPTVAGAATQLSAGYNLTLFTGLASAGLRPIPVDVFTLIGEIRANPAAYGFTNITGMACGPFPPITTTPNAQFCGPTNLVAPGADQTYLFADSVHPTTAGHRIIADFATSLIEGPTLYSMLAEVPLRTRAGHVQTLGDGLANGQVAAPGKLTAFAATTRGNFELDSQQGNPGFDSRNRSYTVGVTMRASEAVTLGAAVGRTTSEGSYGQDLGGFKTGETAGSLFAGVKSGGFFANGAATIANVDFEDSRRTIRLGQVTRTATASPSGSNASAFVSAGYDFALGKFSVGPLVSWTTQNVEVNGFDEAGAGSANLRIGSQKRRSEVASFGVRASWDLGSFTPYARFTADKERKNDERLITAAPLSLTGVNSYDLPAWQPADSSFGTFTVGVRGYANEWVGFGLSYTAITGRGGVTEDYVTGTLSVRF